MPLIVSKHVSAYEGGDQYADQRTYHAPNNIRELIKLKIVTTQLLPFLGVVFANCTFSSKFKVGSPNFIVTVHPFRKQKFVPVKQVLINFNIDYPY